MHTSSSCSNLAKACGPAAVTSHFFFLDFGLSLIFTLPFAIRLHGESDGHLMITPTPQRRSSLVSRMVDFTFMLNVLSAQRE